MESVIPDFIVVTKLPECRSRSQVALGSASNFARLSVESIRRVWQRPLSERVCLLVNSSLPLGRYLARYCPTIRFLPAHCATVGEQNTGVRNQRNKAAVRGACRAMKVLPRGVEAVMPG